MTATPLLCDLFDPQWINVLFLYHCGELELEFPTAVTPNPIFGFAANGLL